MSRTQYLLNSTHSINDPSIQNEEYSYIVVKYGTTAALQSLDASFGAGNILVCSMVIYAYALYLIYIGDVEFECVHFD